MELAAYEHNRSKIHPKKFVVLVACASIMMMFAGLTSAYIIRQSSGNWLEFELPKMFYLSTVVIVTSSVLLHASYRAFKSKNFALYKILMVAAFIAGLTFVYTQYLGWLAMDIGGVRLDGNPSGSFVYALSGIHAAHVLGGIAALFIALVHAYALPKVVNAKRLLRFEMTLIYWHFVDFLWIYLLLFFILQQP